MGASLPMRKELYVVYDRMYREYSRPPLRGVMRFLRGATPSASSLSTKDVATAIQAGIDKAGTRRTLRPDARLALLVNFNEMVALPLGASGKTPTPIARDELAGMITDDAATIVRAAQAEQSEGDVSSGDIFRALAKVYDSLRIHHWELWG